MTILSDKKTFDELTYEDLNTLTLQTVKSEEFIKDFIRIIATQDTNTRLSNLLKAPKEASIAEQLMWYKEKLPDFEYEVIEFLEKLERTYYGEPPEFVVASQYKHSIRLEVVPAAVADCFLKEHKLKAVSNFGKKKTDMYLIQEGECKYISGSQLEQMIYDFIVYPYPKEFYAFRKELQLCESIKLNEAFCEIASLREIRKCILYNTVCNETYYSVEELKNSIK